MTSDMWLCKCGCGRVALWGNWAPGHAMRAHLPKGQMQGDDATLSAIHKKMRRIKGMTGTCEWCGETPPMRREELPLKKFRMVGGTDLHSLTGEYSLDPDEYVEICRKCHLENHKPSIRVYERGR